MFKLLWQSNPHAIAWPPNCLLANLLLHPCLLCSGHMDFCGSPNTKCTFRLLWLCSGYIPGFPFLLYSKNYASFRIHCKHLFPTSQDKLSLPVNSLGILCFPLFLIWLIVSVLSLGCEKLRLKTYFPQILKWSCSFTQDSEWVLVSQALLPGKCQDWVQAVSDWITVLPAKHKICDWERI